MEQRNASPSNSRIDANQTLNSNTTDTRETNERSRFEDTSTSYGNAQPTVNETESEQISDENEQNSFSIQPEDSRSEINDPTNEPDRTLSGSNGILIIAPQIPFSTNNGINDSPTGSNPSQTLPHSVTSGPMRVAISYHGETNDRVKAISQLVEDNIATLEFPNPVFYAPNFQTEIAVLDGIRVLQRIYERAELVVVFLSRTYHNSRFCYNEWRAIKNRFFVGCDDQQAERLLLVRLADFNARELCLYPDDFYIDGETMNDEDIAEIIVSRWRQVEQQLGTLRRMESMHRSPFISPELSVFLFILSLVFFVLSLVLNRSSTRTDLD